MDALDLHVGRPVHREALTLFPVWNGRAVGRGGYDVRSARLEVAERAGQPLLDELVVSNGGERAVLVLEGELLEGGLQNRVATSSTMVEPGRTEVLRVRCVEQGRWHGTGRHHRSDARAPLSIRARREQDRTWQRVRALEELHDAAGATHGLMDALSDVAGAARQLVDGIEPLPFQSGLLVGIGGWPVQLEVFDSPRTLATAWRALLQAAAFDALAALTEPTPGWAARDFTAHVGHAALVRAGANGSRRSPRAHLTCLVWRDRVVHAVATNPRHQLVNA